MFPKTINIAACLMALVGLSFLLWAGVWYRQTQNFVRHSIVTRGIVVDLGRSQSDDAYAAVVEFVSKDGVTREFVSAVRSNPPQYAVGDEVEVFYLESSPHRAKIKSFSSLWGGPLMSAGMGGILFLVPAGMLAVQLAKHYRNERIKTHGVPITTLYKEVIMNTRVEVGGRNPYQVITQWQNPATSQVHVFRSQYLWFDPSDYMVHDTITVLIEKNNPKKYVVDLSFLPKLGN